MTHTPKYTNVFFSFLMFSKELYCNFTAFLASIVVVMIGVPALFLKSIFHFFYAEL